MNMAEWQPGFVHNEMRRGAEKWYFKKHPQWPGAHSLPLTGAELAKALKMTSGKRDLEKRRGPRDWAL